MPEAEPRTLELRDYLRVVRRRKWTVLLAVLVAVPAALALSYRETPVYEAEAKLLVEPQLVEQLFTPTAGDQRGGRAAAAELGTEIQVMSSPDVRKAVADKLGRPPGDVWFGPIAETRVVAIVSTSTEKAEAAETANAYAETYLEVRRERAVEELLDAADQVQVEIDKLTQQIADLDAQLALNPPVITGEREGPTDPRVNDRARLEGKRNTYIQQLDSIQTGATVTQQAGGEVIAEAGLPRSPVNKTPVRNGVAGLGLGLILGVALAFLREYLDDTVKSKEDLERASGLTVVGLIPSLPEWKNRKATPLVTTSQPRSHAAEAYRTLRTSVEFLALEHPISSVQVTSALAQEGKTTTLSNLATSFAKAGQRVIVLCCDLRRPRVHEFFGLTNKVGFTSVLLGEAPLADAIQQVPGDLPLGLVSSGPLPPNPAELLSSKRAAGVIQALDDRCDLLLVDSPPVVPVTDGLVIAGLVDAVLLVADSRSTTKRGLTRAVELLRQIDAPLVGAVLNGVGSGAEYGYAAGKEYYPYYRAEERRERTGAEPNGRRRAPKKARLFS
jgi:capsular exopolysaccharide synthesis family protein